MTDEITIFARVTVAPGALVGALVGAIGAWYSERGAFEGRGAQGLEGRTVAQKKIVRVI